MILIGGCFFLAARVGIPLGKLPGDIKIQGENASLYIPCMTSIILSIVLTIVLNITRIYTYSYGVGNPTDLVTVNRTQTLLNVAPGQPRSVVNSTRFVAQPSNLLDPR